MSKAFLNNNLTTGIVAVNTSMLASGQGNQVIGVVNKQPAIDKRVHKEFVDNANDIHRVVFPLISAVQRVMESNWCHKAPTKIDSKPFGADDFRKFFLGFSKSSVMGIPVIVHIQDEFFIFGNLDA